MSDSEGSGLEELAAEVKQRVSTFGISSTTRARYSSARDRLSIWAGARGYNFEKSNEKDILTAAYLIDRYDAGLPPCNTLSAVIKQYPDVDLSLSKTIYKKWTKKHTTRKALPLSFDYLVVCLGYFVSRQEFEMALALSLSWAGWLRASECLRLKRSEVVFDSDTLTLVLNQTKTSPLDCVVAGKDDNMVPVAKALLQSLLDSKNRYHTRSAAAGKDFKIFSLTYPAYKRNLDRCFNFFGWQKATLLEGDTTSTLIYSSHSVRRGRATEEFKSGTPVPEIQLQGRWADPRSLTSYLKESLAHLTAQRGDKKLIEKYRTKGMKYCGF